MLAAFGLWLSPLTGSVLGLAQATDQARGIPWWVWVIIVLLLLLLFWWWFSSRPKAEAPPDEQAPPATAPPPQRAAVVDVPVAEEAPPAPDDLTRIEGIGPKINGLLQEAGIQTFAQLAEARAERLEGLLSDAGLGALANPATWPEQAGLAASGDWEALQVLQDALKGGRRA